MTLEFMGKKKGMTRVFDKEGNSVVCTIIEAEPNVVVQVKTKESDGYRSVQLGAMKVRDSRKKNITKPLIGHFSKAKVEPRHFLKESRIDSDKEYEVGQEITLDFFADCEFVDVCGKSKGKGYQGVIKRHNFSGGPASHGSGFHRHAGSTGMRSTPGRCLPGVRMPGHMGDQRVTTENLKVVKILADKNLILVKGAIPGAREGFVTIRKALKKRNKKK